MWQYIGAAVALGSLAIGCMGVPVSTGGAGSDDPPGNTAVTVLGHEVLAGQNESLLQVMERNIPGLRVGVTSRCPALSLRGAPNTMPGYSEPKVYVDGARAIDTCILEMLRAGDVERVEIYPMGVTARPGYAPHAHGLILVFTRDE
ncbi:MAG TPA: TonB-dependent receptor plug domain-containing protein [Longimicrobiales bacterium]